jgi:hypothetical protein
MESGAGEISGTKYMNAAIEFVDAPFCPLPSRRVGPSGAAAAPSANKSMNSHTSVVFELFRLQKIIRMF